MKKIEVSILVGLLVAILTSVITPFAEGCEKIRNDVIRIHIIANSNSQQDQNLKLRVKSAIAMETANILGNITNKSDAVKEVKDNLDNIKSVSEQQILESGYDYDIKVDLCKSYFNTREYDTFTLPAGNYDAIKVIIGEGKGKNWWCVAFPPMCMPTHDCIEIADSILDRDEIGIMNNEFKYQYKFAIVEAIESLRNYFTTTGDI